MAFRLQVPRRLRDEMLAQAMAELPNECCGLLAGPPLYLPPVLGEGVSEQGAVGSVRGRPSDPQETSIGRVVARYPLVNAAASPVRYLSDAKSMIAAFRDMRQRGLEALAVYHSHPSSAPVPSRTDLHEYAESLWALGNVVHVILSLEGPEPQIRAWWLSAEGYRPADVEYV